MIFYLFGFFVLFEDLFHFQHFCLKRNKSWGSAGIILSLYICQIFLLYVVFFVYGFVFVLSLYAVFFCMRYCLNRNSEPRQFLVARV